MPATKDEIAAKFMELALRFGYRRTTIADVASALRISKKTVYDFFASKDEVLAYAIEFTATGQRTRVESMLSAGTALGRIEEAARLALTDARLAFESAPSAGWLGPDEISERINAAVFVPMVHDLIAEGVAGGEFEVPDVEFAASFAYAVGMDAVRIIREDPSSRPEAAALETLRRMVAGEVKGGGARGKR